MVGGGAVCDSVEKAGMTPRGFEPMPKSSGKSPIPKMRGSKSGNIPAGSEPAGTTPAGNNPPPTGKDSGPDDPDLDRLIRAWPTLRASTRKIIAGIVADAETRQGGER
jgi:hypothetical protein